ncbi:MAG: hypothetical protein WC780_00275 [Lentimicrobiaceae bacterium]|jgi:hypothetical protein
MKSLICTAMIFFGGLIMVYGQNKQYSKNDWNIDIDLKNEIISLSNKNLGIVLDKIQFQVIYENVLTKLTDYQLENLSDNLIIQTNKPIKIIWDFNVIKNKIVVSSSVKNTFITAVAPASINRFPARVADPDNMLASETSGSSDYTGVTEIEKYYIPTENPQVMYLSLGAIESSNLHSLFDKQTNTVIKFSSETKLTRLPEDQSFVQVNIPVNKEQDFIELIPNYFTDVLGMPNYVPYDDTYHKTAPTGWNHWLAFFRQVTEKDIVDHADFIANNLKAFGMEHCQLDDGYDHVDRRLWDKNWDTLTFPHGPEWLAKYIKSKGLIPGLWTVPYCYSVNDANPDWFLRDDKGNILMDYQGGGELDFTRKDVIEEYWIPLWKEFKRQGWEYHKFDMGNTSYMWHTYQHNFSDTTISSYEAAKRTMTIWREIMGPEVWHVNHPDIDGGRMGILDMAGCGRDPGVGWEKMNNMLEVISNNAYQNHIVWYTDPDCIVLRGRPSRADSVNDKFLTLEEARTCATLLSLSGMQYLSGDDLLNLEEDRLDFIRKTIPTMPIFPIDLFGRSRDRNRYPEIVDLKVNQESGIYDVVAVTNWKNEPVSRSISFEKELALEADKNYIVFDFWQEQMIGQFNKNFQVEIPAHGTRVFFIHKQKDLPQLLGTNRHISGSYSIIKNVWNNSQMTLNGVSETVPGVKYSLYYYIPKNVVIGKINVDAKDFTQKLQNNGLLEVSFTGQKKPVTWNLAFKKNK